MNPIADFAAAVDALSSSLVADLPEVAGADQDKLDALDVRQGLAMARSAAALLSAVAARRQPVQ